MMQIGRGGVFLYRGMESILGFSDICEEIVFAYKAS